MIDLKVIFLWLLSVFAPKPSCKHPGIDPLYIHDNYCPDCGKRIIVDWYLVKCSECTTKRTGFHLHNDFIPHSKYCKRCGSNQYSVEIKQELMFFEYSYASYKYRELDKSYDSIFNKYSRTRVWLEPDYNTSKTTNVYSINNLQLLPATVST